MRLCLVWVAYSVGTMQRASTEVGRKEARGDSLPSWSKSSRTTRPAEWPKCTLPEPAKGSSPKAQLQPLSSQARAVSASPVEGSGLAKVIRMHGAYPRLIGADSNVVLWDLHEAQRHIADLRERLIKREV